SQDRSQVALALERRAGHRPDPDAELLADDIGEARLAEARRPGEQDVVEGLVPCPRRLERDRQLLLDPLLADELVQVARAKRLLDLEIPTLVDDRRDETRGAHAALLRASRTRSSAGRSGSTSARARSASTTE